MRLRRPEQAAFFAVAFAVSVNLHLLNARGRLTPYRRRLEDAFATSVERPGRLLPVPNVNVVVYVDPDQVILALGPGGFSPGANQVFIAVDPNNAHFVGSLEREFL